jgi:hypothetical protein
VAARILIDTNIFLEVLLEQKRWKLCEDLLRQHRGVSALTDFALHSIGVALLGQQKAPLFQLFLNDVLVRNDLLALPTSEYPHLLFDSSAASLRIRRCLPTRGGGTFRTRIFHARSAFSRHRFAI